MPSPKEKPKKAKSKKGRGKNAPRSQTATSAKQAAKLMKDKYVQQLEHRQSEADSAEAQAVEQVEAAGTWAVDEVILHERPRSPRQRGEKIKERPQATPESAEQPAPATSAERVTDRPPSKGPTAKPEYASPSPEGTIIPRQKQAEVGALPREPTFRTAPEGTRPLRTKPAAPQEQEHKVSPRQKYTVSPRQNAVPPTGTNSVQRDGAIQSPKVRPPEQLEAPNSAAAISPPKIAPISVLV